MPQLGQGEELQQNKAGNFGYSAAKLNNLGATEYTLVTIVNDVSGSVSSFKAPMEVALKEAAEMCKLSPRADNLMLRHVVFGDRVDESMGFTLFSSVNTSRFDNCLVLQGSTALNDGLMNAVLATASYGQQLSDADFNVNGLVVVITDGCDNNSMSTATMLKAAINKARTDEKLESLAVIVVGVNIQDSHVSQQLTRWITELGLNQATDYIELKDASKKTLAKLAKFISQSISASSQALGTGGPSKQLTSGSLQQSLTI